jgi:hypothetical protein
MVLHPGGGSGSGHERGASPARIGCCHAALPGQTTVYSDQTQRFPIWDGFDEQLASVTFLAGQGGKNRWGAYQTILSGQLFFSS